MIPLPNPEATRRPGVPVHQVTLADGREWGLALPSMRLRPVAAAKGPDGTPEGPIVAQTVVAYPLEIRNLVDALRSRLAMGSEIDQYESLFNLAAALLRRGHDIDLASTASLLAVDVEDFARFARDVIEVAFGAPRTTAPGVQSEVNHE